MIKMGLNMKKRNILKTGIVILITAVLLSSTSAVSLSNVKAVEKSVEENEENSKISTEETYVDPNLHLTKKDLSWLIKSVLFIKNEDCRGLTIKIIKMLIREGTVNYEQIKQVVSNSDYKITGIHAGGIKTDNSEGSAWTIPGYFRCLIMFVSKGGLLHWEAVDYTDRCGINVQVGFETYTTPHEGIALGYFGLVSNQMNVNIDAWTSFMLDGSAALAFVWYR